MAQPRVDADLTLQALSDSIASIVENVGASTVALRGRGRHALGCGVVWRPGIVVTAAHVFGRAPAAVSVVVSGQTHEDLALVGADASTDLAVFRSSNAALPAVDGPDSAEVRPGQLAILVGCSLAGELTASVSVINRVSGPWQTWLGGRMDRLIRLDGGLQDGLSGAPVANAAGKVLGIATSALSRSHGIVVPKSTVSRIVEELLAQGHVARAFLGIGVQPVAVSHAPAQAPGGVAGSPAEARSPSEARGAKEGSAQAGLLITSLRPGGPATLAGLLIGDIVLEVGHHRAASVLELRDALAGNIGKSLPVSLIRGGAPAQVEVTVGQWPAEARPC
jgi:S1-C subfamily serine protease